MVHRASPMRRLSTSIGNNPDGESVDGPRNGAFRIQRLPRRELPPAVGDAGGPRLASDDLWSGALPRRGQRSPPTRAPNDLAEST